MRILAIAILGVFISSCVGLPASPTTSIPQALQTTAPPVITLTLTAFETTRPTVTSPPTATPSSTKVPAPTNTLGPPTLRGLAEKKNFLIGNYLTPAWFSDPAWQEIVAREFNMAVIGGDFVWDQLEPKRGQLNFTFPDEQVTWALSQKMAITGHPLLLARSPYIPSWLAFGNFSREELAEILQTHIEEVMRHYKGKIGMYIVVEDAPTSLEISQDVFYKRFGYEYIDLAFEIARQADPQAILIYNSGDNETADSPNSALTHEIVARLQSKGLIDGVGFEMHLDARKAPAKEEVIAEMRSYGLPVHVTEIDLDISRLQGNKEERYKQQAQIYGDLLSACLESGVCQSFSLWGIGDKHSWLRRGAANSDPTPFDDFLNPKPAYYALLEALRLWQP